MSIALSDLAIAEPNVLQLGVSNLTDEDLTVFVQAIASVQEEEITNFNQVIVGENLFSLVPIREPNAVGMEHETVDFLLAGIVNISANEKVFVRFLIPIRTAQRLIAPYNIAFRAGSLIPQTTEIDVIFDELVINNYFTPPERELIFGPVLTIGGIVVAGGLVYSLITRSR